MKLTYSDAAKADVLDAWLYIANDSVTAADNVIDQIEATAQLLCTQPKMGRVRLDLQMGLRSFPCKFPYTIYYRVTEDAVQIVRILHQARDITRLFG